MFLSCIYYYIFIFILLYYFILFSRLIGQRNYLRRKYEALKLDTVQKEVGALVQESRTITESLQQQQIANRQTADKRYVKLTKNIAEIGRIVAVSKNSLMK